MLEKRLPKIVKLVLFNRDATITGTIQFFEDRFIISISNATFEDTVVQLMYTAPLLEQLSDFLHDPQKSFLKLSFLDSSLVIPDLLTILSFERCNSKLLMHLSIDIGYGLYFECVVSDELRCNLVSFSNNISDVLS